MKKFLKNTLGRGKKDKRKDNDKKSPTPAASASNGGASASASTSDRHGDFLPTSSASVHASSTVGANISSLQPTTVSSTSLSSPTSSQSGAEQLEINIKGTKELSLNPTDVAPYVILEYTQQQVYTQKVGNRSGADAEWNAKFQFDITEGDATPQDPRGGEDQICSLSPVLPSDPPPTGAVVVSCSIRTVQKRSKLSMDDFEILKVIGKGSFGKVMQVVKKDTNRVYAMKVLKKQQLVKQKEIQHTISERKILAKNTNPFLVGLKYSFQSPEKIYFVLDYINGGELFVHLQREGTFSVERSRLYAGCLILAMDHLHSCDIVYRDLKPENILVDINGFVKLCDFGLCKENVKEGGRTTTFCGTPEYMAPE
eukprot:UC4_evm1s1295